MEVMVCVSVCVCDMVCCVWGVRACVLCADMVLFSDNYYIPHTYTLT